MEFIGPREGGDEDREEEERPDADDLQPAARDRFRGPAPLQRHSAAEGGYDRARGSVHLHGVRTGCGARRRPALGARAIQLRGQAGSRSRWKASGSSRARSSTNTTGSWTSTASASSMPPAALPISSACSGGWSRSTWRSHIMTTSSMNQPEESGANGGGKPGQYYSYGIPYLSISDYPGKLLAIEGTDGVGRSTQIRLLREWLEVQGYGVIETGWTRSELMSPKIDLAKSSNTLNKLTFVLLYATDFADRLEKEIIPALKAGFIVL